MEIDFVDALAADRMERLRLARLPEPDRPRGLAFGAADQRAVGHEADADDAAVDLVVLPLERRRRLARFPVEDDPCGSAGAERVALRVPQARGRQPLPLFVEPQGPHAADVAEKLRAPRHEKPRVERPQEFAGRELPMEDLAVVVARRERLAVGM